MWLREKWIKSTFFWWVNEKSMLNDSFLCVRFEWQVCMKLRLTFKGKSKSAILIIQCFIMHVTKSFKKCNLSAFFWAHMPTTNSILIYICKSNRNTYQTENRIRQYCNYIFNFLSATVIWTVHACCDSGISKMPTESIFIQAGNCP